MIQLGKGPVDAWTLRVAVFDQTVTVETASMCLLGWRYLVSRSHVPSMRLQGHRGFSVNTQTSW